VKAPASAFGSVGLGFEGGGRSPGPDAPGPRAGPRSVVAGGGSTVAGAGASVGGVSEVCGLAGGAVIFGIVRVAPVGGSGGAGGGVRGLGVSVSAGEPEAEAPRSISPDVIRVVPAGAAGTPPALDRTPPRSADEDEPSGRA
jgi:hypothetical protein